MPLDGFPHGSPAYVAPIGFAAHSPYAPDAISFALVNAYMASRKNARGLIEQTYARSALTNANNGSGTLVVSLSTEQRIARGRAYVDALTNRMRAIVTFQLIARVSSRVRLRMRAVFPSSGAVEGAEFTHEGLGASNTTINADVYGPITAEERASGFYVRDCAVDISGATRDAVARIEVFAYAENGAFALSFRPWRVVVYGDVEG
jgi:hypothetical protein